MSILYVLKLENNKYYVGKTDDINRRYTEHKNGKGSEWTKIYKPIKILETREVKTEHDENNVTKDLIKKYGVDNVRGGAYSQVTLSSNTLEFLERESRGNMDSCFKCGKQGHFAKNCLGEESESESEEETIWVTNCCSKEFKNLTRAISHERRCTEKIANIFKPRTGNCYRCGRNGHWATSCYAKTDITGNDIYDDNDEYNSE